MDWRCLSKEKVWSVKRQITIHFISADLMIPFNSILPTGIHKNRCADDIGLEEDTGIFDRTVHMAFCCEIDDDVWLLLFEKLIDSFAVTYVQFDKAEIRIVHDVLQCGQISCIGQLIQTHNPVVRMSRKHVEDEVRAYESGSSGYNDGHGFLQAFST